MRLLVGAAHDPRDDGFYSGLLAQASHVIAVDGGSDLCRRLDRVPDLVVGDLDSIEPETLGWLEQAGVPIERLAVRKDVTDLEAALDIAVADSPEDPLVLTAVLGKRLDHTLAALGALASHARWAPVAFDASASVWILAEEGRRSLCLGPAGATFSVLSIRDDSVVSISGAEYVLERGGLTLLAPRGISNVVSGVTANITLDHGMVLAITQSAPGITRATECGSS